MVFFVREAWRRGRRSLILGAGAALLASGVAAQTPGPQAGDPVPAASAVPVPAAPVFLNHPSVVDTAHIKGGDTVVTLFGIKGWAGDPAHSLQDFISANGDRVTCQPHEGGGFTCMMPTGLDVTATALGNGAAETVADAPASYHALEAAAQAGHLGIWAGLPPAPVTLLHPLVQSTSHLVAGDRVFQLDGLIGFDAQYYTMQLQSYIAAHGDKLSCLQQGGQGNYVCVLPDGTDIAAVALEHGLARVSADASAADRAEQAKAVASRSGFWFNPPQTVLAQLPPVAPTALPVIVPGDLGDGVRYDSGVPVALIGDEPEFLLFAGALGWGFFDGAHRWHAAPEPIRAHLDRFHPAGAGVPGVPAATGVPQRASFRAPGSAGAIIGPEVLHGPAIPPPPPVRTTIQRPFLTATPNFAAVRPGLVRPITPFPIARPALPAFAGFAAPHFIGRR